MAATERHKRVLLKQVRGAIDVDAPTSHGAATALQKPRRRPHCNPRQRPHLLEHPTAATALT
eukprot:362275-Prymnesium_polylepis.1